MKIDKSNWNEFRFAGKDGIFTIKRGKRLIRLDQISGDIAYISSSKKNNGIDNYITPPNYMTIYDNSLTLSNSGSVGYCFYHPYKFVASDHCTVINIKNKNKELNIIIALFLIPIIESIRDKYNFAREISDNRLKKEIILLPAKKNGKTDWDYMENYTNHLSKSIKYDDVSVKTHIHSQKSVISSKKWKSFNLLQVFDLFLGKPIHKLQLEGIPIGNTPYVTRTAQNNGMEGFINPVGFENKLSNGHCITIGAEGFKAFYQETDFLTGNKVNILRNINLNKYNALFLTTVLNHTIKEKYTYGRAVVKGRLEKEVIKLPVDIYDNPDWSYMENFIKSLPYSASI